jgi:prevent-host-death family protein
MEMITMTAAEFQRHFGRYQDEALTQPVAITRNGRERLVMLSADEYRRLKRRDREVLRAGDLSDADLEAIAKTEMDPRHAHLDEELK